MIVSVEAHKYSHLTLPPSISARREVFDPGRFPQVYSRPSQAGYPQCLAGDPGVRL